MHNILMADGLLSSQLVMTLLWVLFAAAVFLAAGLGAFLTYHWLKYAMSPLTPAFALVAYVAGCIVFTFVLFVSAITF